MWEGKRFAANLFHFPSQGAALITHLHHPPFPSLDGAVRCELLMASGHIISLCRIVEPLAHSLCVDQSWQSESESGSDGESLSLSHSLTLTLILTLILILILTLTLSF